MISFDNVSSLRIVNYEEVIDTDNGIVSVYLRLKTGEFYVVDASVRLESPIMKGEEDG